METEEEIWTDERIREYIDEVYPKVKAIVDLAGMTKEEWIQAAIRGRAPQKKFTRCENCKEWECEPILNLKDKYPSFVMIWHGYGTECPNFSPKEGAE